MNDPGQCCFGAATEDQCKAVALWRSKKSPALGWCAMHAISFKMDEIERIHRPWAEAMELNMNADPDITPEKREGLLRMFGILAENAMREKQPEQLLTTAKP
jgi:hypothetical protein